MMFLISSSTVARLRKPRVLIPALVLAALAGSGGAYLILLHPGSIFVHWDQAPPPKQITMISFGPYPEEKEFKLLSEEHVRYIVSLLDPRLPYEQALIEQESALAKKYGMTLKDFPMASIFDQQIFSDYKEQESRAVKFLKHLDAPAYVHCYLGKHRVIHVRDALQAAGVPERYFTAGGSSQEYWDLINRIDQAQQAMQKNDFAQVLEVLAPVKEKDVDVFALRGWAHYRLGLITKATQDFEEGLSVDSDNPRNLIGLAYCDLRNDQPVMAQRKFERVLARFPEDESAWVGQGLAYLNVQNKPAAAQAFRKALKLDPQNLEAKNYLAQAEAP
jgi:tetratricopeptide (TPR) repeat protein